MRRQWAVPSTQQSANVDGSLGRLSVRVGSLERKPQAASEAHFDSQLPRGDNLTCGLSLVEWSPLTRRIVDSCATHTNGPSVVRRRRGRSELSQVKGHVRESQRVYDRIVPERVRVAVPPLQIAVRSHLPVHERRAETFAGNQPGIGRIKRVIMANGIYR